MSTYHPPGVPWFEPWWTRIPAGSSGWAELRSFSERKEGFLKSHLKIHGEWKDCFLYAVLREEWESKDRAAAP
jgi:hypothetical protein